VVSDHNDDLLEEASGNLPEDNEAVLAVIDRFPTLFREEKLLFRQGRRGGALKSVDELNDPVVRRRLQSARRDLMSRTGGDVERFIKKAWGPAHPVRLT